MATWSSVPLAPIILGGGVANHSSLGAGKQWDVAFFGGGGILGVHESDTCWHGLQGMLRWKPASRPVMEATLRDFFFFSLSLLRFFQQLPAAAETSQAIAGFLNSVAHQLIITLLASSFWSSGTKHLDTPRLYHSTNLTLDNRVLEPFKPGKGELILHLIAPAPWTWECRISRG